MNDDSRHTNHGHACLGCTTTHNAAATYRHTGAPTGGRTTATHTAVGSPTGGSRTSVYDVQFSVNTAAVTLDEDADCGPLGNKNTLERVHRYRECSLLSSRECVSRLVTTGSPACDVDGAVGQRSSQGQHDACIPGVMQCQGRYRYRAHSATCK